MKIVSNLAASAVKETVPTSSPTAVCMHVLGRACIDHRVMRSATTLVEAGFAVSIIDIETERGRPVKEDICDVQMKHIVVPNWYISKSFKPWFLMQAMWMFIRSTI